MHLSDIQYSIFYIRILDRRDVIASPRHSFLKRRRVTISSTIFYTHDKISHFVMSLSSPVILNSYLIFYGVNENN